MFTLSLAQMNILLGNRKTNQETARELAAEAARSGSQMVLLPELFTTGYDLPHWKELASNAGEGDFAWMAALAKELQVSIAGSVLERAGNDIFNTFTVVDQNGTLVGTYRKMHLFKPMNEEQVLRAGNQAVTITTSFGLTGLSICYDLRFAELYRKLAHAGASLILVPAEWPASRIEHWKLLLRARAVENQVFVAGANCAGLSGGSHFGGCSAIIDPSGATLVEASDQPGVITAQLDSERIKVARRLFSTTVDSRKDLFGFLNE